MKDLIITMILSIIFGFIFGAIVTIKAMSIESIANGVVTMKVYNQYLIYDYEWLYKWKGTTKKVVSFFFKRKEFI